MKAAYSQKSRWIAALVAFMLSLTLLMPSAQSAYAAEDYVDVSFAGTFTPQKGYTTGGEEVAGGGRITWIGDAVPSSIAGGGARLAGGTSGITYTAANSFGSGKVEDGFLAEFEYSNAAVPANMATLFSAMGNIYVRAEGDKLAYGFSAENAAGQWEDYKAQVDFPARSSKHIIQLKYQVEDSAQLTMWVDGVKGDTVISDSGQRAAISDDQDKVFGIGYEVNPASSAATRGFAGDFFRVRIADAASPWKLLDHDELLHVDFLGHLDGANYAAVSTENNQGTLKARTPYPRIEDSVAVFNDAEAGFDFTAPGFTLGDADKVTTGFVAEAAFTPAEAENMQTIFGAGGNIFLRYKAQSQLEFGISYQDNDGTWKDSKIIASAPANEKHVVSIAYVPEDDGTAVTLYMRVDGEDQQSMTANHLAVLNPQLKEKIGFANDVHPQALNRGFKGALDEIRVAAADPSFTSDDFKLVYTSESCDVSGVKPANIIDVQASDCTDLIKAKLSALRPTEKQADYLDWGQIGFVHFNVNTFTGKSWGHGDEDPAVIDVGNVDTDQWAQTFADAGFKMMMVTVKHHDGFELFDSRYNDAHDWPNTAAAKNGGSHDLFADIVKSARKYGLKVGVYYSPADSYMEKKGVWGNNSAKTMRQIPTLVAGDDRKERVESGDLPKFEYEATDYGEYMLNQLYELLTDYGTIDEVWFDGAQGNTGSTEFYDYSAFYDLIGKLQPHAVQANAAPDARWIGNEEGWARQTEWNPQGVSFDQYGKITLYPSQMAADGVLGSADSIIQGIRSGTITKLQWYPGEVDAKNGPEWFNNSNKQGANTPKSMKEIVTFYEQSTGRNAQFLLNMPPYIDGRMPKNDVDIMKAYREELLRRYGMDVALGKEAFVAADASAEAVPAPKLTDGSKISSDEAAGSTPIYTVKFGKLTNVDAVILGEDARSAGQQVEAFKVQGLNADGEWQDLASGTTIGQQRNLRFNDAAVSDIRLVVERSRGPVRMARLEAFHSESEIQDGPRAYYIDSSASKAGSGLSPEDPMTSIEQLHDVSLVPGSVLLVKRGTTLTGDFAVFGYGTDDQPIIVTTYGDGADPKVALKDIEATSLQAALEELGKDAAGWAYAPSVKKVPALRAYIPQEEMTITGQSSHNAGDGVAQNLLDGKSSTIWHSQWNSSKAEGPHWVVLDLGEKREKLQSLDYLARMDGANGTAKEYEIWVSDSPETFDAAPLISGTLENVPYTQRIDLKGASGRYLKFQIDSDYSGQGFGAGAELNVKLAAQEEDVPSEPTIVPETPEKPESPSKPDPDSHSRTPKPADTDTTKSSMNRMPNTGAQIAGMVVMSIVLLAGGAGFIAQCRKQ